MRWLSNQRRDIAAGPIPRRLWPGVSPSCMEHADWHKSRQLQHFQLAIG
jgi:hypothetical protein